MKQYKRAGGQWGTSWSTLDHVRSLTMHARSLLLRGIPQDQYALFTEDEAWLISSLNDALRCIEKITRED